MNRRRNVVMAMGAMLASGLLPAARAQGGLPVVTTYKTPTCGCCGEWVKHLRANGFRVETHDLTDLAPIKRKYGVPQELSSCHTAVVAGYAIEGHVPAADIKRLLRDKLRVRGLAVPAMVPGSPGMEGPVSQPYATLAFDERGHRVFAQH